MNCKSSPDDANDNKGYSLKLFVAGDEYNSRLARENLENICEALVGRYALEIIDVFQHPEKALENGIFLTPALIKISPPPRTVILGNLSDETELCRALGLRKA